MKESVYIENYLKVSVEQKVSFLQSLYKNEGFKIANQEVVFCEESVIFDFNEKSDIDKACKSIKNFFKENKEIKVDKVTKMRNKAQQVVLKFDETKKYLLI